MNPVFWILLCLTLFVFWVLCAFAFKGIGKLFSRLWKDVRDAIEDK